MESTPRESKDQVLEKLRTLETIIREGDFVSSLLSSEGWQIIRRTILAQCSNYENDCYDAAKDTGKNIANFLGRLEALKQMLYLIEHAFQEASNNAQLERELTLKQLEEVDVIEDGIHDEFTRPMDHEPGTL